MYKEIELTYISSSQFDIEILTTDGVSPGIIKLPGPHHTTRSAISNIRSRERSTGTIPKAPLFTFLQVNSPIKTSHLGIWKFHLLKQ